MLFARFSPSSASVQSPILSAMFAFSKHPFENSVKARNQNMTFNFAEFCIPKEIMKRIPLM